MLLFQWTLSSCVYMADETWMWMFCHWKFLEHWYKVIVPESYFFGCLRYVSSFHVVSNCQKNTIFYKSPATCHYSFLKQFCEINAFFVFLRCLPFTSVQFLISFGVNVQFKSWTVIVAFLLYSFLFTCCLEAIPLRPAVLDASVILSPLLAYMKSVI